ncbi:hypothetical protein C5167_003356 [Papaver somniferum]|uniref:Uncharacterized protein n=1 Tax=Papaver somniferum TaxID=3469 RepID=A0A4Y7L1S3_PAPSO|nr:hypothetical protein C5167_003356 [Papaver somniferum]
MVACIVSRTILDSLTREVKEVGPDGKKDTKVACTSLVQLNFCDQRGSHFSSRKAGLGMARQTNTSHGTWRGPLRFFQYFQGKGIDAAEVAEKQALSTSSKTATKMVSDRHLQKKCSCLILKKAAESNHSGRPKLKNWTKYQTLCNGSKSKY